MSNNTSMDVTAFAPLVLGMFSSYCVSVYKERADNNVFIGIILGKDAWKITTNTETLRK